MNVLRTIGGRYSVDRGRGASKYQVDRVNFGRQGPAMQKHRDITLRRLDGFVASYLEDRLYPHRLPLTIEFCDVPHADERSARAEGPWRTVEPGFKYGRAYTVYWFRLTGTVPAEWAGHEVALLAELGSERTWWENNSPSRGIDNPHAECRLIDSAQGGEAIDLAIQAYAMGDHIVVSGKVPPRGKDFETVKEATLVVVDTDIKALTYDFVFWRSFLKGVRDDEPAFETMLRALNDVCNTFRSDSPESVLKCRKILRDAAATLGGETKHTLTAVGHAHLDTAWLWPLRTTHLKMAHTTATQLYQMARYPEYVFVHSQASQYEWLEQEYPALFNRVKDAVKSGQWEPVGSMWVEADCNLTGSESLIRQFLYGRRYFQEKLGYTTDDMWLPDVFGYSAALPQILQKFGIKYFLTQKISWNQLNKFPHHTFWWQGIDGTSVWTHFPPADTYNAQCDPEEILKSVRNFRDKGRSDQSMYVYGHGDGGGGPTELHIELLRRARQAPELPEIQTRQHAVDFFREAYAKSKDLCTWSGELYLEFHRGTYTSQAANKKGNRESEFLLRDAELLACMVEDFPRSYPSAKLEELWKLVLLNQFHDIIPGSSVTDVYEDSALDYAKILAEGTELVNESLRAIGHKLDTGKHVRPIALFSNATVAGQATLPWDEAEVPASLACNGERYPVQLVEQFGETMLVFPAPTECLGTVAVADLSDQAANIRYRMKAGPRRIENGELAVRFDPHGNISSISTLDDQPMEFIEPGRVGNLFQIHEDLPNFWDAWDVDPFAFETAENLIRSERFEIVERGPVRVAAEIEKHFGNGSVIRQRISLGPTPGIRFDTWVDWRESHRFLKVAFPVNVNSARATYEIQFGHVERPTHANTSWDMAKFEVCAQKWADLSEGGHGISLLNDGKYGYDIRGNVMRLSLLRSPKAPDPTCDMGVHRFSYVLLPHYDQLQHADVVASAYMLNAGVRTARLTPTPGEATELPPFVAVDTRHLVVEAVKKAEDDSRIVARIYEAHNTRGMANLSCARGIRRAWLADLNETPIRELEVHDGLVRLDFKPFEILTILLES